MLSGVDFEPLHRKARETDPAFTPPLRAVRLDGSIFFGSMEHVRSRLAELAAELPGIRAITQTVDITDHEALSLHAGRFVAAHGAPDIVIANAGISVGTLTEEREDRDVFARVMAVNVQASTTVLLRSWPA